ncbi:MAG: hypothetical protein J4G09_01400 [Proteobacteria bacterium]|nr:hypothetical protein [Pseudomonadota bacterium]
MGLERFEALAEELARRQAQLPERLSAAREAAEALRQRAAAAVAAFVTRARALGAEHLGDVVVSEVEPDEKHVDCLQFSVERGRHVLLCVAIAGESGGKIRLVGPFRRGKTEGPCADQPLRGPEVEAALDQGLLDLLRGASEA